MDGNARHCLMVIRRITQAADIGNRGATRRIGSAGRLEGTFPMLTMMPSSTTP
jgi:hypothetical protein